MMQNKHNGVIIINKPIGFTSHDVVAKLRGILSMKKIGHTGTLDPDAVGVLPVCVGNATKISDLLTSYQKEYEAEVTLGSETDTQDSSGSVIAVSDANVSESEIRAACGSFVGEISQIPPMYSAIKQDGKKLYELARAGIEVERKPRTVTIDKIEITDFDLENKKFSMRVLCSKGTYIRTLCSDIGKALGCYAHMSKLCRTKSGDFCIADAITLDSVESLSKQDDFSFIIPVDLVLSAYPPLYVSQRKAQNMCNGMQIRTPGMTGGTTYRVYDEGGRFLTVSRAENGVLKIIKTFYT